MKMPKLKPPEINPHNKKWLSEQLESISKEQDKSLTIALAILSFSDPGFAVGFLACYGVFKKAMLRQETEELEAMFKDAKTTNT